MTTVDSTPATKADVNALRADLDALEQRLEQRFDAKLDAKLDEKLDEKLANYPTKQDLADALDKFARENLAHAFNLALEQVRIFIGALDDKHTHRTDQLQRDLDAHRADATVHRAPRTRKSGSR